MSATETFTATEFKARCLEIFDRLAARKLTRAEVTKRGKVVAVLTPPDGGSADVESLYGCMRGRVVIPAGFDLTAPILDEPLNAERGLLFDED